MITRLDNLVAKSLQITRSQSKKLISKGGILVNGVIEKRKNSSISEGDSVEFLGKQLLPPQAVFILLNKPAGYICSTVDESLPSALNLINNQRTDNLHFAGRLDADTTGLVLITSDGSWSHRVTSPKFKLAKRYRVGLSEPITDSQIMQLENGVILKDSEIPTNPAKVTAINKSLILLSITEGRYHQVKRMLAAVKNHVTSLHREAIGDLELDSALRLGESRILTQSEVGLF